MWSLAFWKATLERCVRGAAVAVFGGYFAGDVFFDALDINAWSDVGSLAVGGAFGSLLLSLIGNATTGTGPSLVSPERLDHA